MQLTIQVDLGQGPYQVTTTLADTVEWERKFKAKAGSSPIGLEDIAFLAYQASKTSQITVPVAFDDFLKKLVNLDVIDGDNPENPTQEAATGTL